MCEQCTKLEKRVTALERLVDELLARPAVVESYFDPLVFDRRRVRPRPHRGERPIREHRRMEA